MFLKQLSVTHFRCFQAKRWEFGPQFNCLLGPNGSGKTAVLEAVFLLSTGKSFRTHANEALVHNTERQFTLSGQLQAGAIRTQIALQKSMQGQTVIQKDGKPLQQFSALSALLPVQLLTPAATDVLLDGPSARRSLMDWGCFYTLPQYLAHWKHCKRLLKQRNALLKQSPSAPAMGLWERELARHSDHLAHQRACYVAEWQPHVEYFCQQLLPQYDIRMQFYAGWDTARPYLEWLQRNQVRDRLQGYTHVGPHKADLRLTVHQMPVEQRLSRGELKCLVACLRLAQAAHLLQTQGKSVIFLLDDIAAELDTTAREALFLALQQTNAQCLFTSVADQLVEALASYGNVLSFQL